MCLYTLDKKPKIAEKDIVVYKWLGKDGIEIASKTLIFPKDEDC